MFKIRNSCQNNKNPKNQICFKQDLKIVISSNSNDMSPKRMKRVWYEGGT